MLELKTYATLQRKGENKEKWQSFLQALKSAEIGEGFKIDDITPRHRTILAVLPCLIDKQFTTRKISNGFLVVRVA